MLYKCDMCNYSSKRCADLQRHKNRKTPCYSILKENLDTIQDNIIDEKYGAKVTENRAKVMVRGAKVMVRGAKVMVRGAKVKEDGAKAKENEVKAKVNEVKTKENKCCKCNKLFVRTIDLRKHEIKCDGLDKRQCRVCLKVFATKQSKYEHTKYVKCETPLYQTTNNNVTNITNNNITNNTTNNNINIRVDFGDECLKQLCEDNEYLNKMMENIHLGKYAIPKTIEEIYFNDKYPQNQTLKKARKNDKMVSIQYNGKWETRLYDDIINDLVKKTEEYHKTYFRELQNKYECIEKNREFRKMMIPLRRFANRMLWFGWKCNEIRRIGLELDDCEDMDEEDVKKMVEYQKDIKQLMIDKIYYKSGELQMI